MRVGVDLDGCNIDFIEGCNAIRERNGEELFVPGAWDFYTKVGMSDADFVAWCNKAADDGQLFSNPPVPGAIEANRRIADLGHEIIFITDRSFGNHRFVSQELTHNWLNKWGFIYDYVMFSADKTCVETDIFVEDKLENYDALIEAGTLCCLIDKSWNQDPELGNQDGRYRIKDISEFADIVEAATDQLGMYA